MLWLHFWGHATVCILSIFYFLDEEQKKDKSYFDAKTFKAHFDRRNFPWEPFEELNVFRSQEPG